MRIKRLISFLIIAGLFLLLPTSVLGVDQPSMAKNIEVRKGEVIDQDFFAAGESVTISGVVNGDVYAAGANVSVDGTINGDLLAGAGIITILGEVTDDVRVGGGNVLVNGVIGKNLTVGGGSVTITSEAKIGGSLLAFAGNVDARGPIGRGVNVFAGRALFANQVGGDLKGSVEELVLTSQARILGDLEYEGPAEAEMDEGAIVFGETIYKPKEKEEMGALPFGKLAPTIPQLAGISFLMTLFGFIASFVLGFIFVYLFPKRVDGINKVLTSRPWGSFGTGLLAMALLPIGLILLTITIVGIPLVLLIIPVFVFLVYFSKIFTSLVVGRKILVRFEMKKSWNWALLVGLAVYYLLGLIPVVGMLTGFVFVTLGLGAFLLDQKALRQRAKK